MPEELRNSVVIVTENRNDQAKDYQMNMNSKLAYQGLIGNVK
jgi:hypothetical protein